MDLRMVRQVSNERPQNVSAVIDHIHLFPAFCKTTAQKGFLLYGMSF